MGDSDHQEFRFIPARAGNAYPAHSARSTSSVHPRAGGERRSRGRPGDRVIGSSPRGRGTPQVVVRAGGPPRFIPARAGNAATRSASTSRSTVHPRAGGERRRNGTRRTIRYGSSPRGRGTRIVRFQRPKRIRFIPARAGNAFDPGTTAAHWSVHPRAGGERNPPPNEQNPIGGSSPRGRGTPVRPRHPRRARRFIPARAGNALSTPAPLRIDPVHPRAGGERLHHFLTRGDAFGSSPRGRGTLDAYHRHIDLDRFIPARAGNANRRISSFNSLSVHPRAGGERSRAMAQFAAARGSSPRGRGTPGPGPWRGPARRLVHPRAGGERRSRCGAGLSQAGSSPRGRGTLRRAPGVGLRQRFIPARAGNAPSPARRAGTASVHPRAGGERGPG